MLCLWEIIGCVTFLFFSNDPANLISENLCSGSVVAISYHTYHLNSMDGWIGDWVQKLTIKIQCNKYINK